VSASEKIARLRELRAKATPAPWQARKEAYDDDAQERQYVYHAPDEHTDCPCAWPLGGIREDNNAAVIVAAMNSLDALLECASVLMELDRLGLVVESAVRSDQPPYDDQVTDLIDRTRLALQALAGGGA
jgi:hypothetical protein